MMWATLCVALALVQGATPQNQNGVVTNSTTSEGLRVSGRVVGLPAAIPQGVVTVSLTPRTRTPGVNPISVPVGTDGRFEFSQVKPARYTAVVAYNVAPTILSSFPETAVDVSDKDIRGLEIAVRRLLVGRVRMEDGSALPLPPTPLGSGLLQSGIPRLSMVKVGVRQRPGNYVSATIVLADGQFMMPLTTDTNDKNPVGEFQVHATQLPFGLYVKSIIAGGADLRHGSLKLSVDREPSPIEITLTTTQPPGARRDVRVRGHIANFPKDQYSSVLIRMTGSTPDITSPLGIFDQVHEDVVHIDADGRFEFSGVPPGSYRVNLYTPTTTQAALDIPGHDVEGIELTVTAGQKANSPGTLQIRIPEAATQVGGASQTLPRGTLVLTHSDSYGFSYIEGALTFFLVSSQGAIVEEKQVANAAVSIPLAPGAYELRSYLRPCDGNCGLLDPPTEECRASFTIASAQTLYADRGRAATTVCGLKFSEAPLK